MAYSREAHHAAEADRRHLDALLAARRAALDAGREFGALERLGGRRTGRAAVGAVATGLAAAFVAGLVAERERVVGATR